MSPATVTFHRLAAQEFRQIGRKGELPAMPRKGKFKDDAMTFIQPVKLEPGRTYRITINSVWQPGFASAAGLPLDPIQFTFTTAKR